jgi:hypothetical protein
VCVYEYVCGEQQKSMIFFWIVKMQSSLWPQEKLIFPACIRPAKLSTTACQHTCVELDKSWKNKNTKISTSTSFCSKYTTTTKIAVYGSTTDLLLQLNSVWVSGWRISKRFRNAFFYYYSVRFSFVFLVIKKRKMYKTIEKLEKDILYFIIIIFAFQNKWNTRLKNCLQAQLLLRIHVHAKLLYQDVFMKFFHPLCYTLRNLRLCAKHKGL